MFKTFSLLFKQTNMHFLDHIFEFTSIILTMGNFLSVFLNFDFKKLTMLNKILNRLLISNIFKQVLKIRLVTMILHRILTNTNVLVIQ